MREFMYMLLCKYAYMNYLLIVADFRFSQPFYRFCLILDDYIDRNCTGGRCL